MNNKYEERLGTERMLPLVFKMALPAVAAQFVNLLYSIVDRIYIGHIPGIGTDALAGVGVTTSLIILISSFSAIVGGGGAPLAAIALGQGDRVRAGKILGNGFVLLILFTLLTSVIAYTFMEPILLFTGASENTLEYAVDYLSIYLLGTIFVEISTGLNSFINAQGRPAIAMFSVLIGALLNIILDPIFIIRFDSTFAKPPRKCHRICAVLARHVFVAVYNFSQVQRIVVLDLLRCRPRRPEHYRNSDHKQRRRSLFTKF